MAPGIYPMSKLLDQTQGRTRVTTIRFYPGSIEGTTGSRFMKREDRLTGPTTVADLFFNAASGKMGIILATYKLRENVGASELTAQVGTRFVPDAVQPEEARDETDGNTSRHAPLEVTSLGGEQRAPHGLRVPSPLSAARAARALNAAW